MRPGPGGGGPSPLAPASVSDIVLASEMDAAHVAGLRASVAAACEAAFGLAPSPALNVLADLLYYGLTLGLGRQTLGEEVCDLLSSSMLISRSWRQGALAILLATVPFLQTRLELVLSRKSAALVSRITTVLGKMHRAVFYWFEDFENPSRRAFESRLYLTRPPAQPRPQYKALAVFIALQLFVEGASALKALVVQMRSASSKDDDAGSAVADLVPSSREVEGAQWMGGCGICLSPLTSPACPPCGHVYCYTCIVESSVAKDECPTCRQKCLPQTVLCLYS